jgi:A/G-specific adenine glycosylase
MKLANRAARQKRGMTAQCQTERGARQEPDAGRLLAWYGRHRRRLPWRAEPGKAADPYRVWLSEIMLQQTTVRAVGPYYEKFLARFPTLADLARARLDDVLQLWAGLGYYARARNLHACARAVLERHRGEFPDTESQLRALPGIGTYTAAAIAAIAFGRKSTPVDGNVERVIARLFAIETPLPHAKPKIRAIAESLTPSRRTGDFAQAMMDLGSTICTPKRPACALCPWSGECRALGRGDMDSFPRKTPKAKGRLRRGAAFVAIREDGAILLRTRPAEGLLGGMTEVPTTEWTTDFDPKKAGRGAPLKARWRRLPGAVRHVFTHFPLELTVYRTLVPKDTQPPRGARWSAVEQISGEALPKVMHKVIAHAGVRQA